MTKSNRDTAIDCVKHAVATLARAFNACDEQGIPYRYGDVEQERFRNVVFELIDIVERGKIESLAHLHAKQDRNFQEFMRQLKV
mgnify:CR=1 FL=1